MSGPAAKPKSARAKPPAVADIDALYGLEPVYEPGTDPRQRPLDSEISIQCPYCWESYESNADLTLGAQAYVEDCQICCRAISVQIAIAEDGFSAEVTARRIDE